MPARARRLRRRAVAVALVAAARALRDARRRRAAPRIDALLGERVFARGAARLAAVAFLDDDPRAASSRSRTTAAAGRRLGVLAALLDAHAELAARLRGAEALGLVVSAPPEAVRGR